MELTGKLTQILAAQTGTGKNGSWKKCDFIIETTDKFSKSVCVTAWKELADQIEKSEIGTLLTVSFDLSSREFNGKWYTDVKAWKIIVANKDDRQLNSIIGEGLGPENRKKLSDEEAQKMAEKIEALFDGEVPF